MLAFAKKHRVISAVITFVFLVALALGWSATAATRGKLTARYDVHQGHYYILAYGLAPAERAEYARLLKQRYGIELRKVADCIVSESLVAYVDNYDHVSAAAAKRKFGHDIFEECWKDAVSSSELRKSTKGIQE
jgi:hypothetical protein